MLQRLWKEDPEVQFHAVSHKIDVQGHEPIRQEERRYSLTIVQKAQEELQRFLDEKIVEPSNSPWCSQFVMVPKDGGELRFCIDYRDVNKVTKEDAYRIPHMDAILDKLRSARFISKIDLKNAYHQVPMDPASKEITAFAVPERGLFQFTKMPFGLTNAPATFQALMNTIFVDLIAKGLVAVYLDDILVFTKDLVQH